MKVGSVVVASVVEHERLRQLLVASRTFSGSVTGGTVSPRSIIPAASPAAIRSASVLLASIPPFIGLCGVLLVLEFDLHRQ